MSTLESERSPFQPFWIAIHSIRVSEASVVLRTRPQRASGSFPKFCESSEAVGLADRANGDFVAVSREWFAEWKPATEDFLL